MSYIAHIKNIDIKQCILGFIQYEQVLGGRKDFNSQVESGKSGVKVELWNMIRLCQNLQFQIVWN